MKQPLRQPCAEWADMLAAVSLADLSPDDQAALQAHLATCAACAAIRADYQRMDARIRAWPAARPLNGLPPALVQLWAEEGRQPIHRMIPSWSRENGMNTKEEKPVSLPKSDQQPRHRPMGRLISGVSAVAAVVVIAVIVTALVFSHGGQPAKTGNGHTPSNSSQGWQTVPHLTHLSDLPVIAPGNPQVVYQVKMASSNLPTTATLQRSDDDGATWHTLSVPAGITQVYSVTLMVSPLSAQSVFVQFAMPCSTAQANTVAPAFSPLSGGADDCLPIYFSTDGGAHWSLASFPSQIAGERPYFDPATSTDIQAQGNRLYLLLQVAGPIGSAGASTGPTLVSSDDGGATWQFVDQSLTAQGDCVTGYAATPTGSTVFAAALEQCGAASGGAAAASSLAVPLSGCGCNPSYRLWRSDDAGAKWSLIGPVPDSRLHLSLNGAGQPTLFLPSQGPALGRGATDPGAAPQFSTDGGNTWQAGPVPAGQINSTDILGTLSDGSILVGFTDSKTQQNHLFSWKPGDAAWQQVAGNFQGAPQYVLVLPSGSGQQTLWLVTLVGVADYTVQRSTL